MASITITLSVGEFTRTTTMASTSTVKDVIVWAESFSELKAERLMWNGQNLYTLDPSSTLQSLKVKKSMKISGIAIDEPDTESKDKTWSSKKKKGAKRGGGKAEKKERSKTSSKASSRRSSLKQIGDSLAASLKPPPPGSAAAAADAPASNSGGVYGAQSSVGSGGGGGTQPRYRSVEPSILDQDGLSNLSRSASRSGESSDGEETSGEALVAGFGSAGSRATNAAMLGDRSVDEDELFQELSSLGGDEIDEAASSDDDFGSDASLLVEAAAEAGVAEDDDDEEEAIALEIEVRGREEDERVSMAKEAEKELLKEYTKFKKADMKVIERQRLEAEEMQERKLESRQLREVEEQVLQKAAKPASRPKSPITEVNEEKAQPEPEAIVADSTSANANVGIAPSTSLAYFSGFAPPVVHTDTTFVFNVWAYCKKERERVMKIEAQRGNSEAGMKGPLRIKIGSLIEVVIDVPKSAFKVEDPKGTMEWEGEASNCSFAITCKKSAKPGTHVCKTTIIVEGKERGALMCQFQVRKNPNATSSNPFAKLIQSCAPFLSGSKEPAHDELRLSPAPYFSDTELQKQQLLGTASTGRKSIRAVSPAVDINGTFTIYPSDESPHIFLSYRRMHIDLADRIRRVLMDYGYKCFLDISDSGLEAGSFTEQLREKLQKAKIVIPILTPAPAGKGDGREEFTSLGWVKEAKKRGVTDWCHEELKLSLQDRSKIILPVFRGVDLSEEFRDLPEDIAALPDLNCRQLHDDLFDQSVEVVHKFIQAELVKREIASG